MEEKKRGRKLKQMSPMIEQIRSAYMKAFGTQRAFCEQAGYKENDFPKKLSHFQKSVDRLDKFLKQFDLKIKLTDINDN